MNLFLLSALFLMTSFAANAAQGKALDYLNMSMGLFGGLALFLYGMEKMSHALKQAAGSKMKTVLATLTKTRINGVLTGAGLTAIIQSSSVTTVLLVGFVSAGIMSLNQTVSVIMGANIGTTITAQIIAFKVTQAALAMIAIGFVVQMNAKREAVKNYSNILLGLGMLFLGMNLMSEAMAPLRTYQPFIDVMAAMDNPLLLIAIAAAFTALVQSSSATTGIVIVLAGQGFISLESGIAMAMGANIGTCVTAILATIGKNVEAKQTSAIHLLFNLLGVVIWLPLVGVLAEAATAISPTYPELSGVARLAAESPRQIANANTAFNIINTLLMLPFSALFVKAVKKLIPPEAKSLQAQPITVKYVSKDFLSTPDIALEHSQLEIGRMGRRVVNMMNQLPSIGVDVRTIRQKRDMEQTLLEIEKIEMEVNTLHACILSYLGKLRLHPLTKKQSHQQIKLVSITNQLENIADVIVHTLLPLRRESLGSNFHASPEMRQTLEEIEKRVAEAILDTVNAIRRSDKTLAVAVLKAKRDIDTLLEKVLEHQAERLSQGTDERLASFRLQMEWVESLKRIYTLSRRIGKLQLRKQV